MRNFNWLHPRLQERMGHIGKGTFATGIIERDALVAIFGGYICKVAEEIGDHGLQIERDFVISPFVLGGGEGDFINHSCEPNCGIRGQISVVTMREIAAGEEITFDYGSILFATSAENRHTMGCQCGATSCRKLITSEDWRSKELQTRLGKFFPYFILDEIEAENQRASQK